MATGVGLNMYCFFSQLKIQGFMSTDPNTKYMFPDGSMYSTIEEVEDWMIKMATQIRVERQINKERGL